MVFALLISAIIWNLGTWSLGLPASSSHTLIGSIVGVGVANALMRGQDGTSGVDWGQVTKIGQSLLLSPLFGFILSALLLLVMKALIRKPALYTAPTTRAPPPLWIRGLLILTCTLRFVLPRLQRRTEGHGPDHAHPHRRRADRLRAQPRAAGKSHTPTFVAASQAASKIDRRARRRLRDHRRSAPGRHRLHPRPQDLRGHLPLARRAGEADRRRGPAIRLARQDADRQGAERPQRHVLRLGSDPRPRQGQGERAEAGRSRDAQRLQEGARPLDQVHSDGGSRSASPSRSASAR